VIKIFSSSTVVKNTSCITLEVVVGSIDGNTSWTSGNGRFEGIDTIVLYKIVGGNLDNTLGFLSFARFGIGNVWVRSLEFHWVFHGIFESVSLHSTIATVALFITINQLGFSELDKLSGLDEMSSFHGCGRGESPAGTTLSLVLDWVYSTFGSPVDMFSLGDGFIEESYLMLRFV
jgi:hypothetical protein